MDKNPNDFPKDVNKKTTKSKKQQIRPTAYFAEIGTFPRRSTYGSSPASAHPKNA